MTGIRGSRIFFWAATLPLWLALCCLCIEVAYRIYDQGIALRDQFIYTPVDAACKRRDDVFYAKAAMEEPPPDTVLWQIPERMRLDVLTDEEWHALALARQEYVLLCNRKGEIFKVFACDNKPAIAALFSRVEPGMHMDEILPEAESGDALSALAVASSRFEPRREYVLSLPDGKMHAVEMDYVFLNRKPECMAVFIDDSIYEIMWTSYRPHVYRHNRYRRQFERSDFWTNELGFRDEPVVLPKPEGTFRIVCIGGSTTVEGPHNALTYPQILEGLLRDHFKSGRIEVINCGVDAIGFSMEHQRIPEFIRLEPDVIIHYNLINSLAEIICQAGDNVGMREGWFGRLRSLFSWSLLLSRMLEDWFLPPIDAVMEQSEAGALAWLNKMASEARASNIQFVACSFAFPNVEALPRHESSFFHTTHESHYIAQLNTFYYERVIRAYNERLRRFCDERGIPFVPVAEGIVGGLDLFSDICHLRLPGIEKKARIVADRLIPIMEERCAL